MTLIETYTGGTFDYDNPRVRDIDIRDIAHALSLTCRFGGHCSSFYSVAEHAVRVREIVRGVFPFHGLAALHHDSHEAYLGDVPTPLKQRLGVGFRELAGAIDQVIARKFGLWASEFHDPIIKAADHTALLEEAWYLKPCGDVWNGQGRPRPSNDGWRPRMSPASAERAFLEAHYAEVRP